MSYTATIKYTKTLVRRALNHYMLRRLGVMFFVALISGVLILAVSLFADVWNWFMSVVAVILVFAIAFVLFVYFARMRAAEGFFDKGDDPVVTFQFDENGVRTKWTVFEEILKFPDLWLLVYAKSGYMTLPLDQLTRECRELIETKVGSTK